MPHNAARVNDTVAPRHTALVQEGPIAMSRVILGALCVAAAMFWVAGCTSTPPAPVRYDVTLASAGIAPASLPVLTGDSVTWTNADTLDHGVLSDDSITFGTTREMRKQGGVYGYRFTFPGTYGYRWTTSTKPGAVASRGTIVVTPRPSAAPTAPH